MAYVLVDQDGVLAEWSGLFAQRIVEHFPDYIFPFLSSNDTWDMDSGLDEIGRGYVEQIKNLPGFYADLQPIAGAAEALREMVAEGHTVHICTSPWPTNPTCASDKLDWLEKYIGAGWAHRAVITSDKTLCRGDYLIDDRPDIVGAYTPEWEHIVFDAPYNQTVTDRRRMMDWSQWRNFIH